MKWALILSFLLTGWTRPTPSVQEVRQLYDRSVADESACRKLTGMLKPYTAENNPLLAGYRACATMVMAKHVFSPVAKYSYFKEGRSLLEKAISKAPSGIELRFLRFTVQTNLPWFLNYNDEISTDKKFLLRSLPGVTDLALKQKMIRYFNSSAELSKEEKKQLPALAVNTY